MLGYLPAPAAAGALVWSVNDPLGGCARQPRRARRARRRGLSKVVSRMEQSAEYRRSLGELHALASSFQHELDPAQRERWLVLEEALLAHCERLSHAYYHAGFRYGVEWSRRARPRRRARRAPPSDGAHASGAPQGELEAAVAASADCLAALARLLLALARRGGVVG